MPTLDEYVTFSLEDWKNVQALQLLVRTYIISDDPEPLLDFFKSQGEFNLLKYAIHWPVFEEVYRLPVFARFWIDVLDQPGLTVNNQQCYYDIFKQEVIRFAIASLQSTLPSDMNTDEGKFYYVAIDCLLKKARSGYPQDKREETQVLLSEVEKSVGYVGSLLLAELYMQIARAEENTLSLARSSVGFFQEVSLDSIVICAQQQAYVHLKLAVGLLALQTRMLSDAYREAVDLVIVQPYQASLSALLESLESNVLGEKRREIEAAYDKHKEYVIQQLGLAADERYLCVSLDV